jgi:hypothetical protein
MKSSWFIRPWDRFLITDAVSFQGHPCCRVDAHAPNVNLWDRGYVVYLPVAAGYGIANYIGLTHRKCLSRDLRFEEQR